jgi:hypothetical protein
MLRTTRIATTALILAGVMAIALAPVKTAKTENESENLYPVHFGQGMPGCPRQFVEYLC